jgi:hypothetical protein
MFGFTAIHHGMNTSNNIFCVLHVPLNVAEKVNAEVLEAGCVIELPFLNGRDKIQGTPLFVLVEKEGA